VSTIDGLRVDWPDGFGLMRASNTTPVLVLRFEGHTEEALQRIEARCWRCCAASSRMLRECPPLRSSFISLRRAHHRRERYQSTG
jgi:hypothetical protein